MQDLIGEMFLLIKAISELIVWAAEGNALIYQYMMAINAIIGRKEMFYLTTHSTHFSYR